MSVHKAAGPDFWQYGELRLLPLQAFERLASLLEVVEEVGVWPQGLTGALVTLVPKPGATVATELRPIGLMATVYRLWAVARQEHVRAWLRPLEAFVAGGRPGVSSESAALEAAICADEALASGDEAAAAFLDIAKAYEGVDHALLASAAVQHGFPARLVWLAIAAYRGPRRVLLFGTPASRHAEPRRGIIAGCPIAVALMSLYLLQPLRRLSPLGLTLTRGYVDDITLLATGAFAKVKPRLVQGVVQVTGDLRALGLTPSTSKLQVVASTAALRSVLAAELGVEVTAHARDLGVDFTLGHRSRAVLDARLTVAAQRATRVAALPLGRLRRSVFVRAEVLAVATYGSAVTGFAASAAAHLRALCARALIGGAAYRGSKMARTILLNASTPLDPWVVGPMSVLKLWARQIGAEGVRFAGAWARTVAAGGKAGLVTDTLFAALQAAGLHFDVARATWSRGLWHYEPAQFAWAKAASAALFTRAWEHMALRRQEFLGAPAPPAAAFQAVRGAHRGGRHEEAGLRLVCLTGGTWSDFRFGVVTGQPSGCQYCGHPRPDACHRLWVCPRWQHLRVRFGVLDLAASACSAAFEPRCLWECGLPWLLPPEPPACDMEDIVVAPPAGTVAFTDASAFGGDDPPAARAGWAFSDADGTCSYGPLPGFDQSVDRAELFALVRCTSVPSALRRVYSDSLYVVRGAASAAEGVCPATNGDLWVQYRAGPVKPLVAHVPAHLTQAQAALRGVSEHLRLGNEVADKFARVGALAHAFTPAFYAARKASFALASRVQDFQWRFLREVLKVEGRHLRVARRGRVFLGPRRRPGPAPGTHCGAHDVAPSGAGFQCLRCHRVSRSAQPRAWRFRPCVAVMRRHRAHVASPHQLWFAPRRVGCWACGRQVAARNQARLLASPCLHRGFGNLRHATKRGVESLLDGASFAVPSGSFCIRIDPASSEAGGLRVKRRLCQKTFVFSSGETSPLAAAFAGPSAFPVPLRRVSGDFPLTQAPLRRDSPPWPSGHAFSDRQEARACPPT
ncbi:MAG: hypothetical protein GY772_29005, partial [bacterium]|nr:hypothetical protein [bacterium]